MSVNGFVLACPRCKRPLTAAVEDVLVCSQDDLMYHSVTNIWRFLLPERAAALQQFMDEYETVRQAEGWGSQESTYYLALPFADMTGRHPDIWHIRARSFGALLTQVVEPFAARQQRPLRIVDVGAGNGWLSYRLTKAGHKMAGVDLMTNPVDGLGAQIHYDVPFLTLQAEFDHLPFVAHQMDMVIFNGAFHYATDYEQTLQEARSLLRPGGCVVIMDSPVYQDAASGQQMVQEREDHFEKQFGFRGNALPHENYLTIGRLQELGASLGWQWQIIKPFYGWRWAIRPWLARLRRHREPASFFLMVGRCL